MKRVLMISTGGTIASVKGESGLTPKMAGEELIDQIPQLRELCSIDYRTLLSVDSANIQPEDWQLIARTIFSELPNYDGFVVTHGTNTMAYTAAAVSVMLAHADRPIIFTGSQIPLGLPNNDAYDNILGAFTAALNGPNGVYILFRGKLIYGLHASKQRTCGFDAFVSVNKPLAGTIRDRNFYPASIICQSDHAIPTLDIRLDTNVLLYKLIPGTDPSLFALIGRQYRGIILETFGSGGIPNFRRSLLPAIKSLIDAGIPIVATTQCLFDGCDFHVYDIGCEALNTGILCAGDLTSEAAVVLLMAALGRGMSNLEIARIFRYEQSIIDPLYPRFIDFV